jgi:nucleoside-diphosphate-sugar epimerase
VSARRIGITGVAGFIGSNLADRLLAAGYEVVGFDNLAYGVREQIPSGVEFYEVDIRGREIYDHFAGLDVLFHLAAKNCIADCQADPLETSDINVTGSVNVFEAARRADVGKVVYAESSALYEGSHRLPTPESDVHPQSFYAVSKLAGMAFADAYRRFFGLRTTALRYFGVYGPRQDYRRTIPPVMSAFILKLLRGERPVIYGSGEKRRDFIYVDDVNDFHLRCIDDERTEGEVYNLGSGVNYSVREIYAEIASLLGSTIEPEHRPDLPGEAQANLADITAARALGWEPKVDLREGLRRSIDYIRNLSGRSGLEADRGVDAR